MGNKNKDSTSESDNAPIGTEVIKDNTIITLSLAGYNSLSQDYICQS